MIAEIIIDIVNQQVNRSFDYHVPPHMEDVLDVGFRVRVPFGRSMRLGFVIALKKETKFLKKLKDIYELVDVYPVLSKECIELAKYIAENNFSFYATALQTMIPSALKIKYQKIATLKDKVSVKPEVRELFSRDTILIDNLPVDKQKLLFEAAKEGYVLLDTKLSKRKDPNETAYVVLKDTSIPTTSRQGRELISYLEELDSPIELELLMEDSGYSKSVIQTLVKKGNIEIIKKEKRGENVPLEITTCKVELNEYQKKAIASIDMKMYKTYLLHGITGSGKTEVYMDLIEKSIAEHKNAILLVPEISLTPQITNLFLNRFGQSVAILHSRLSKVERYNEWRKIYNQSVRIVIGARSAVFAPLENIGIIIIDECHEASYIQQNNPKYNTLEIASIRAKNASCPVVLGTATPNVSEYYYATNGEYELLTLPTRANQKPLPKIEVVDLREELKSGNRSMFSRKLQEELKSCYHKKEQSILFLNRRGYASFVMCRSCGETIKCPHCDVSLTYHARTQMLICHYCGYKIPNVVKCTSCGSDKIRYVGSGTEKIVDEVHKLLPEAKVLRMDMDTTSKLEDYEDAFFQFKNHEADILIGTQMITKGLDFSDVTLVGILNADLALAYPTYDATQTAYNLIEQVSGRAGRSKKLGRVILQTYNPDHYVIQCVKHHDYDTFYTKELAHRRLLLLPPFSTVVEIEVSSLDQRLAYKEASIIVENLKSVSNSSIILGPTEAFLFKKKDMYTYTIQIQAVEDAVLDKVKYIYPLYQNNKNIRVSITRVG